MPTSKKPWSSLLFAILFFLIVSRQQTVGLHATDTISKDRPLSGSEKLISKGAKFMLGFFQPDASSQKWYIGIWYNQISVHTPVWVANRQTPVSDPASSQLIISADGNMVLLNHSTSPIWSTNVTHITSNSTVGVILDTGNLILAHASNTSNVLWQSFDHFSDTWLPGGKLGRNKVTGVSTRLIAWKDYGDPAPGMFSLELDPNGTSQYLLQWNSTQQYWTSGNWTGHMFTAVPEMMATNAYPLSMYAFEYVNTDLENYFTYGIKGDEVVTRFVVDVLGQIKFLTWVEAAQEWMLFWSEPKAQCEVYSLCGPFSVCTENALPFCNCLRGFNERYRSNWMHGDHSAGCVRNAALQCGGNAAQEEKNDGFYTMANVKLPDTAQSVAAASAHDCELTCLNNCSCTAYSYSSGCSLWYGDLINLQDESGATSGGSISIRLAASQFSGPKITKRLIIGLVVGGVIIVVVAAFVIAVLLSVSRSRRMKALTRVEGSLIAFTYRDLRFVTKNFAEKLGGGGFGSVFKGLLPDATVVAVKKLEGVRQGEKQFRTEVSTLGTIRHVNLIQLLGFCSERARRLLVYEHMPNGSLDRHLFKSGPMILSWSTRYQIALGIARGLEYLHEKCRDCIIHCDIKPENILLDESFVPKVADFGLAKLVGRDFSRVLTTMRGTVGYLAPEWITGTAITTKADVFSYGMMLFEIISGRRNVEQRQDGTLNFLPSLTANKLFDGDLKSVLDCRLAGNADMAELERACKIACWCVQDGEDARPTMGAVVQVLEELVDVNIPPIPRSLQVLAETSNHVNFFSDSPSN